jgi:cytochrome P450
MRRVVPLYEAKQLSDIYLNDRLSKSHAYLTTFQTVPENSWNTVDKTSHRSRRRVIGSVLNEPFLRQFQPTLLREIDIFLNIILSSCKESGAPPLDMTDKFQYLTLDIIGHMAFGLPHNTQTKRKNRFVSRGLKAINYYLNVLLQFPSLAQSWLVYLLQLLTARQKQRNIASLKRTIKRRTSLPQDAAYDLYYVATKQMGANLPPDPELMAIWPEATVLCVAGQCCLLRGGNDTHADAFSQITRRRNERNNHECSILLLTKAPGLL